MKTRCIGSLSGSIVFLSRTSLRALLPVALIAAAIFSSNYLRAEGADEVPGAGDARALRLTGVDGTVKVEQDGQLIADPAYDNLPLFEGAQITTGNDGRAEVQMEDGSLARLSPNTSITFSVLQRRGNGTRTEIVLNRGLGYFELQPSTADHTLRVNYGATSFTSSSFSVIRVNQDVAPGALSVFSGNIHLERGDALQLDLHAGESLSLDEADLSKYSLSETIDPDSWDSWNSDRDQLLTSESAEKTSANGDFMNNQSAGMSDLDANGNWYNVPGQGYVWSPFEAVSGGDNWDPYGYGHWVYYPRYGYVWVSGYNWGYAPFQCGLWNFYDNFGWGWAPGMGCNPWYDTGGGWFYNIGTFPRGYRPPRRPLPGPPRPRPIGGPVRTASIVTVDRRPVGGPRLPSTGRNVEPVVIAGHTVEPLRPLAPRPVYDREGNLSYGRVVGSTTGGQGFYSGTSRIGSGVHPVYPGTGVGPVEGRPHAYAPPPRPSSGGGGGGHVASAPAPSHTSGGGGGGGGGAVHK